MKGLTAIYPLSIFHARENRRSRKLREVDDVYLRCRGMSPRNFGDEGAFNSLVSVIRRHLTASLPDIERH
jgi:hypothetical protein